MLHWFQGKSLSESSITSVSGSWANQDRNVVSTNSGFRSPDVVRSNAVPEFDIT